MGEVAHHHIAPTGWTRLLRLAAWAAAAAVVGLPAGARAERVSLQLKWSPQFQFAGYYMAQARGFYAQEGLEVTIRPGWPQMVATLEVASGRADFGVGGVDVLQARGRGQRLVSLAAIFQHSASATMVLAGSPVRAPMDLAGRTLAVTRGSQDDVELAAVLRAEGVDPELVRYVERAPSMQPLIDGRVDAQSVYVTNEPHYMDRRGIPYRLLRAQSYGIDFYGDTLFTTEHMVRSAPGVVARFRRASIRGWYYALDHQAEAIDYLVDITAGTRYARDPEQLGFEANQIRALMRPALVEIGHQNPSRWEHIQQVLVRQGTIKEPVRVEDFVWSDDMGRAPPAALTWSLGALLALGFAALAYRAWSSQLRRAVRRQGHELRVAHRELEARNRALHAMIELGHVVARSRNVRDHVAQLLEQMRQGTGYDSVGLLLFDEAHTELQGTFATAPNFPPPEHTPIALDDPDSLAARVARGEADGLVEDEEVAGARGIRRKAAVALRASGTLLGVLAVDTVDAAHPPADEHLRHLRGLADEVALALHNAHLYREAQVQRDALELSNRELAALVEFGRAVSEGLEPDAIIRHALHAARTVYGFDRAAVFLARGDALAGTYGTDDDGQDEDISGQQWSGSLGLGTSLWASLVSGETEVIYTPDANASSGLVTARGNPVRQHVLVPLRTHDQVLGVLTADNGLTGRPFTRQDGVRLLTLARHVATALQNAQLEAALRDSEEQLRVLVASQPAAIYSGVLDHQGRRRIRYISPQVADLAGVEADEAVALGAEFDAAVAHPDDLPGLRTHLAGIPLGHSNPVEYRLVARDGTVRWVLDTPSVAPSGRSGLTDVAGTIVDVTERRALEEQLRSAQKMETVGTLAGGIAHDFNNLLTIIGGNIELARLDLPEGSPALHSLTQTLTAVSRAADLTRQLLAFSRKTELKPQTVDLPSLVSETAALVRPSLGKGIELVVEDPVATDPVCVDLGQVQQVFINLCVNARDAMPEGGTITVRTATVTITDEDPLKPIHAPSGRYSYLQVSDTGMGMDEATRQRAFEPFFTTKPVGSGTGLGLAMAFAMVSGMHGWIDVASAPGHGSTFRVFLPSAQTDVRSARHTAAERGVLVVDSDGGTREELARILESLDYVPLTAASAPEAMALLWAEHSRVRAVVCAAELPNGGTEQLIQHIRGNETSVPVLLAVHGAGVPPHLAAVRTSISGVVRLPFDGRQVASALRSTTAA